MCFLLRLSLLALFVSLLTWCAYQTGILVLDIREMCSTLAWNLHDQVLNLAPVVMFSWITGWVRAPAVAQAALGDDPFFFGGLGPDVGLMDQPRFTNRIALVVSAMCTALAAYMQ